MRPKLNNEILSVIEDILARGNTAEIKMRKDDIIILEATRKIKHTVPLKRE